MVASLNAIRMIEDKDKVAFDEKTMIGCLANYISTPNDKFQPMNANFGILEELDYKIKDKKLKYSKLSERSLEIIKKFKTSVDNKLT